MSDISKNNPNFLKSIQFEKNFPPFEKGTKIEFGGEIKVQNMIEFYLKNKGVENFKENAERFKINCVLGNNGGGKSSLLLANYTLGNNHNSLDSHRDIKFTFKHKKGEGLLDVRNNILNNRSFGEIISGEYFDTYTVLDDFLKLSGNIKNSVNREVLSEGNLNNFYYNIHDFLNGDKKDKFKKIFESYLKIENINTSVFITSKNIIQNPDISAILINSEEFIKDVFKGNEKYLKYLLFTSFYYYSKEILDLLSEFFSSKNNQKDFSKAGNKISKYLDGLFNKFTGIQFIYLNNGINIHDYQYVSEKEEKLTSFLLEFENSDDIINNDYKISQDKYFELAEDLRKIKREILNIHLDYTQININNLNGYNKKLLDYFFTLDLQFNSSDKSITFDNLSAGQKTILVRFTNIYKHILDEFTTYKNIGNDTSGNLEVRKFNKDFLILIDEPDLHLHLDWQRQYIQKLIDVFSTLDSEINLHFVIATHSPFIISDLPKESLVLLNKGKQVPNKEIPETFGANYIDIIKNGFFFDKEQMLMGSFAQNIIGDIADDERTQFCSEEGKVSCNIIEKNIGDNFLKDNLLYFKPEKND